MTKDDLIEDIEELVGRYNTGDWDPEDLLSELIDLMNGYHEGLYDDDDGDIKYDS